MKLLIIHAQPSVKTKWIEPLRNQGWGVLCVSSTQEADQVLQFHGRSLNALVLHREHAGSSPEVALTWFDQFKGKSEYSSIPTVIVSGVWGERDILKHQNSACSANVYLQDQASVDELKSKVESFTFHQDSKKAIGQTSAPTVQQISNKQISDISLEDVSLILAKPEVTRTNTSVPIKNINLAAPNVFLGGKTAVDIQAEGQLENLRAQIKAEAAVKEAEEAKVAAPVIEPEVKLEPKLQTKINLIEEQNKTVIIAPEVEAMEGVSFEPQDLSASFEEVEKEMVIHEPIAAAVNASMAPAATMIAHTVAVPPLPLAGAAASDLDTLKNYLSMREQDVAVLTGQLRSAQEHIHQLEVQLKVERARSIELQHTAQKQEQQLKNYDSNKQVEVEVYIKQVEDLNVQLSEKTDKVRVIETKLRHSLEEVNKIKERVRVDLRRIRVREKDLESQLEVLKKDSAALLLARDEKITELKRKLDLLEFNMELIQEQYNKERSSTEQLRQRLKDASHAMKQAGGYLEQEN